MERKSGSKNPKRGRKEKQAHTQSKEKREKKRKEGSKVAKCEATRRREKKRREEREKKGKERKGKEGGREREHREKEEGSGIMSSKFASSLRSGLMSPAHGSTRSTHYRSSYNNGGDGSRAAPAAMPTAAYSSRNGAAVGGSDGSGGVGGGGGGQQSYRNFSAPAPSSSAAVGGTSNGSGHHSSSSRQTMHAHASSENINKNFKVVIRVRPPLPRELQGDKPFQNVVRVDSGESEISIGKISTRREAQRHPMGAVYRPRAIPCTTRLLPRTDSLLTTSTRRAPRRKRSTIRRPRRAWTLL